MVRPGAPSSEPCSCYYSSYIPRKALFNAATVSHQIHLSPRAEIHRGGDRRRPSDGVRSQTARGAGRGGADVMENGLWLDFELVVFVWFCSFFSACNCSSRQFLF